MSTPNAIETFFTPAEQQVMHSLKQAKEVLQHAYMNNPMVNAIITSCSTAGLIEIDQLRVLCANLLNQHQQASEALINMDNRIKYLEATRFARVQRQFIETWVTDDIRFGRCNDGTVWEFKFDRYKQLSSSNPRWQEVPGMSAPIPQPSDEPWKR